MRQQSICILLCIFNNERFIEEQLRSINCSSFPRVAFLDSDDGFNDNGLNIACQVLKDTNLDFEVLRGPGQRFAENFRSLILNANPSFNLYAFCDQDDFWHQEKLIVAAAEISKHSQDLAVLYGSRTRIADEANRPIDLNPVFSKAPSFQNALVQSIAI